MRVKTTISIFCLLALTSLRCQPVISWEINSQDIDFNSPNFVMALENGLLVLGGKMPVYNDNYYHAALLIVDTVDFSVQEIDFGRGEWLNGIETSDGRILVCGGAKISPTTQYSAVMLNSSGEIIWGIESDLQFHLHDVVETQSNSFRFVGSDTTLEVSSNGALLSTGSTNMRDWDNSIIKRLDSNSFVVAGGDRICRLDANGATDWEHSFGNSADINDLAVSPDGTIYFAGTIHTDTTWVDDWGEIYWLAFQDRCVGSINSSGNAPILQITMEPGKHYGGFQSLLMNQDGLLLLSRGFKIFGLDTDLSTQWINTMEGRISDIIQLWNGKYMVTGVGGDFLSELYLAEITSFDFNSMRVNGEALTQNEDFQMLPAYPNPFNNSVNIRFHAPGSDAIDLFIHDLLARPVMFVTLIPNVQSSMYVWNGHDQWGNTVKSGVYFVTARSRGMSHTQKLLLLK